MAEATLLRNFEIITIRIAGPQQPMPGRVNVALASFQGLYLQYQKHHLLLKVQNTSCISSLTSYEQVQEHTHEIRALRWTGRVRQLALQISGVLL